MDRLGARDAPPVARPARPWTRSADRAVRVADGADDQLVGDLGEQGEGVEDPGPAASSRAGGWREALTASVCGDIPR